MGIPLSRCHNAHDGIPRAIQRYLQCCIRRPKRDLLEAGFLTPRTTSTLALIPINRVIICRVGMKPKMINLPSHRSQPQPVRTATATSGLRRSARTCLAILLGTTRSPLTQIRLAQSPGYGAITPKFFALGLANVRVGMVIALRDVDWQELIGQAQRFQQ